MKIRIEFPVTNNSQIHKLKVGDELFIDGFIIGIRDASLIRIFDEKVTPPIDLRGAALLHTAPGVKKVGKKYYKVCIGTTTSTRMNRFTEGLLKQYYVKAIIGKGGLFQDSVKVLKRFGGCYLAITGGAAALETMQIEDIQQVFWEDLMPECLWKFKVKDFGPLVVAIDAHGHSLYEEVKQNSQKRLQKIVKSYREC